MLEFARITDALPVVHSPAYQFDEYGLPVYSPSLLVDCSSLNAALVATKDFRQGCEAGFDGFFESNYDIAASSLRSVSAQSILDELVSDLCFNPKISHTTLLLWHVGFWLGYISACVMYENAAEYTPCLLALASVSRVAPICKQ